MIIYIGMSELFKKLKFCKSPYISFQKIKKGDLL